MKKIYILVLFIVMFFYYVHGNITVYNAQSLGLNVQELGIENINFSNANFGFVP